MLNLFELYGKQIAKRRLENPIYKPKNIGASRFGLCPRQTILMFTDESRNQKSTEEIMQEEAMFRVAKMLEIDYARQWKKAGVLFSHNAWTSEGLPEGFVCQIDYLLRDQGVWKAVEFKASHPNVMNYTDNLPKAHNILQAETEVYSLKGMGIECKEYCVIYVSRGGGGKPFECWRKVDWSKLSVNVEMEISKLKNFKEEYDREGNLPPMLDRQLTLRKEKENQAIKLEPNWQCNPQYCPFNGQPSCQPNMQTNKIATLYKGGQIKIRKGYEVWTKQVQEFCKPKSL